MAMSGCVAVVMQGLFSGGRCFNRMLRLSLAGAVQIADRSLVWNSDLIEALELENLLINATVTVTSAEQRTVCAPFKATL